MTQRNPARCGKPQHEDGTCGCSYCEGWSDCHDDGGGIDVERERVFEVSSARISNSCERCKMKRPKTALFKRVMGEQMSVAFLCGKCTDVVTAQATEAGKRIRAGLEKDGVHVE